MLPHDLAVLPELDPLGIGTDLDRSASDKVAPRIVAAMLERGVIARAMPQGDIIGFAPPLSLTREEADTVVSVTQAAVADILG